MITIYPDEETRVLWAAIKKIAQREGKSASDIARQALKDYVKKHGSYNDMTPLDLWQKHDDAKALPTLWEAWGRQDLESLTPEDLHEIQTRLAGKLDLVTYHIRDREVRTRGHFRGKEPPPPDDQSGGSKRTT